MNTSSKFNSDCGFYLKGVHELSILQEKIHDYIEHFAVCPDCGNPRLKFSTSKQKLKKLKNKLTYRCNACGNQAVLKAKHKNAGKMFKYMCNILITDKKKNRKTKRSREELASSAQEEEVAAWNEKVFDDWVMDSGPERAIQEHAKEAPLTELDLVPETTPQGLLREVLNDPNKTLLDRTAEFNRILSARRIEDELKIARVVTKSTLDVSSKDTLLESIQKHGVFLGWFCADQERALMIISLTSDALISNGLLSSTADVLERMYDSQVLTPKILLHWDALPAEQCYILDDPEDVYEVKMHAEPFISWLKDIFTNKI